MTILDMVKKSEMNKYENIIISVCCIEIYCMQIFDLLDEKKKFARDWMIKDLLD